MNLGDQKTEFYQRYGNSEKNFERAVKEARYALNSADNKLRKVIERRGSLNNSNGSLLWHSVEPLLRTFATLNKIFKEDLDHNYSNMEKRKLRLQ